MSFHLLICNWYIIYDTEIEGNKEDLISLLMLEYYLKFRIIYRSLVGQTCSVDLFFPSSCACGFPAGDLSQPPMQQVMVM